MIPDDVIKAVIGTWNAVAVLRQSGLKMTPVQFRKQLEKQGLVTCPTCRRYMAADKPCVCKIE